MTKLRHYDDLGTARFVTFCCYHRFQLLNDADARYSLTRQLERIRSEYSVKLYGYVIMPEHVHLVVHPPDGVTLGPILGQLKAYTSREVLSRLRVRNSPVLARLRMVRSGKEHYTFWQRRCYDHNCRSLATVKEKIGYCHKNPIVRGLVKRPGDWKWSSYNYYHGGQGVPLSMDEIE